MGDPAHAAAPANYDGRSLGESLGPALIHHCQGRLRDLAWFRSSWQRGGAATAFGEWLGNDGRPHHVMVKLPVGPTEFRWTTQLAQHAAELGPTPHVLASGTALAGYDLAWLVIERLDGHTLTHGWCRESLEDLLRAVARMQARAAAISPVSGHPSDPDWDAMLHRAREIIRESPLPEAQHWKESERHVRRLLPTLAAKWAHRPIDTWCHGDLHPGNAMWRVATPHQGTLNGHGPQRDCVLIDLALVHPGNWVEDAVYLERQYWGHADHLFGAHTVSLLGKYRRELGLPTEGDYGALANLRRVLMAACAPLWLAGEGNPKYLHAALETIDRLLPQVAH
jgi:Ser/Thr protein kinase RdoA (MazF antagonist)